MAGGCYRLGGRPLTFQATGLGSYLLYGADRTFLAARRPARRRGQPPRRRRGLDRAQSRRGPLHLHPRRRPRAAATSTSSGTVRHRRRRAPGAAPHDRLHGLPRGRDQRQRPPLRRRHAFQEVRGYVDPHVHGQTHEFLGGRVICSPPFHKYGAPAALVDCPDHQLADGRGARSRTSSPATPRQGHDPVGWPTFSYWPNPHSLTHQQVYYKWLERSWRAGLRIHTSLLTENHILCTVYPLKKNSCDDRDAVRLQAQDMRAMQDYIDAQYGGPGRGWYRIVTGPVRGAEGHQRGQARGGHGHGDLGAAGVQRAARPADLHRGADARRARRDEEARRQPDGADQQVRQRLHRRRRRHRDDRPADQQRQLPQHRLVPADADLPVDLPARHGGPAPVAQPRRPAGRGRPAALPRPGRHLRRDLEALRRPRRPARAALPGRAALQPARPEPARPAAAVGDDRQQRSSSTPTT